MAAPDEAHLLPAAEASSTLLPSCAQSPNSTSCTNSLLHTLSYSDTYSSAVLITGIVLAILFLLICCGMFLLFFYRIREADAEDRGHEETGDRSGEGEEMPWSESEDEERERERERLMEREEEGEEREMKEEEREAGVRERRESREESRKRSRFEPRSRSRSRSRRERERRVKV